jgi:hypothetical protein
MGKKNSMESEEARLKKKIADKHAGGSTPGAVSFRALRKRLKREQRRRRALALRKKHAAGSKGAAAPASA